MGFSVVTTILSAAASGDLTDLAAVKDELSITVDTSKDSWLSRAISQMSRAIANETDRAFVPELLLDTFDIERDAYPWQTPGGIGQLQLSRWPVIAVQSVTQYPSPGTTKILVEGTDFRLDPDAGVLLRLDGFTGSVTSWEAMPVSVRHVAGYGAGATENHSVASDAPYQASVSQPAAFACDLGVTDADGVALARVAANPVTGQYSVEMGVYSFNVAQAGASLTFAFAVKAIPDDLEMICLRLVNERFRAKDRDPTLIQQETPGVGVQRWWFGGAPGQKGQFAPDIEAALENYRVPVVK